jgi:vacuolar-type H+-ATPase subunit E/Vma4
LALDDILRALEDKADTRVDAIKAETEQRVQEIMAEVEKDAERTRRTRLKKVEDQIRSEATGIVYSASLKAKNQLIKAQEETVEEAFRIAEQRLADLHKSEDYPKVLEVLLDECLEFFPEGDVLVQVRPEDRGIIEKLLSEKNRPYSLSETPLDASGGVVVSSPEGEIAVSNTFESRLHRAKDHLRLEISKSLFEARA